MSRMSGWPLASSQVGAQQFSLGQAPGEKFHCRLSNNSVILSSAALCLLGTPEEAKAYDISTLKFVDVFKLHKLFGVPGAQLSAFPGHVVRFVLAPCNTPPRGGKYLLFHLEFLELLGTTEGYLRIPPFCVLLRGI